MLLFFSRYFHLHKQGVFFQKRYPETGQAFTIETAQGYFNLLLITFFFLSSSD